MEQNYIVARNPEDVVLPWDEAKALYEYFSRQYVTSENELVLSAMRRLQEATEE